MGIIYSILKSKIILAEQKAKIILCLNSVFIRTAAPYLYVCCVCLPPLAIAGRNMSNTDSQERCNKNKETLNFYYPGFNAV